MLVIDAAPRKWGVLVRMLRRTGYRVLEAANPIEARRWTDTEKGIDLLVAEFSALGASGAGLVRRLSVHCPQTTVLVAADWLWEVEACLGDLPRVGILAKPFTATELARMTRQVLERVAS